MAQNVTSVPVNASVQNAITLAVINPLNYGTIVAINDATETATAAVSTADAITFTRTNAPAFSQAVGGTPSAGEITLDGVVGATINVTLNNVTAPTLGTDIFTIGSWVYSVNGSTSASITPGTPVTYTATALDTLLVGATITTPAQATLIADGAYVGSFDIVASY